MNDLKPEKAREKPEIRKGQIRSFTAKNNTINKKLHQKQKNAKAPILAIKSKKKLKKKQPLLTQKSIDKNFIKKESLKNKNSLEPPQLSSESKQTNLQEQMVKKESLHRKQRDSEKKSFGVKKNSLNVKKKRDNEIISEDEVEYEHVSGVNERRRR
jgi:hypothetical protein